MYTVYKIINNLNQKTYVGVHKTDNPNDYYMGSGKAIEEAIKKYGKENFEKQILFATENKEEAYTLERELTVDFNSRDNYNMKLGGVGGFTGETAKKGYAAANFSKEMLAENGRNNIKLLSKDVLIENGRKTGLAQKGKPKSEAHKEALREAWRKKKLSQ
jgi:hypothetical protein